MAGAHFLEILFLLGEEPTKLVHRQKADAWAETKTLTYRPTEEKKEEIHHGQKETNRREKYPTPPEADYVFLSFYLALH